MRVWIYLVRPSKFDVATFSTLAVVTFKPCRVKWSGFAISDGTSNSAVWMSAGGSPWASISGAMALGYALHAEALTMASVLGAELVCSSYNPASHKRRQA